MTVDQLLEMGAPPIVGILRGVTPATVAAVGEALVTSGITMIEVPLNSPEPYASIARLTDALGPRALCGAGTVLDVGGVNAVCEAGGKLIVTPNTKPEVIVRAMELGLESMPGVATPTEAFAAAAAGATRLKLFPAGPLGPGYLKAIREVLPPEVRIWAVGGTDAETMSAWLEAGAEGIGVGGALYRPGMDVATVARNATDLVAAWKRHRAARAINRTCSHE